MAKNYLRIWKKIIVALHKDGVGYKKIAETLKLTAARWPRPYSGLTGKVSLRTGLAMVDRRSWVHVLSVISRGCVWEIDVWVPPALLQRLKGWRVSFSSQTYAAHCIKFVCMAVVPEGSLFKDDAQERMQTVCWRQAELGHGLLEHVLWSDESKINLFGSDGVKRVWCHQVRSTKTSVSCLQSSMVVGCHGLGLHECCRHWGATVHWGNHECQQVLWHTEAEYDPLPSETGPQGNIPTW